MQGITLTHLLRDMPEDGVPATLLYAVLLRLLDALTTLHKHGVTHDITPDKIILYLPEAPAGTYDFVPPTNSLLSPRSRKQASTWPRAKHLTIHLLLSSKSQMIEGRGQVTKEQSTSDTTALVKLIHSLTQKHAYFLHKAENESSFPSLHSINNLAINPSGPPYISELADELNGMMTYPSSLENARGYFRDYVRLALYVGGGGGKMKTDDIRDTRLLRKESREEGVLPGWITCFDMRLAGEKDVARAVGREIR
jgi:hypothetical protein